MTSLDPGLPGQDDETRRAFRRLILFLADSKRLLGIRYSDWLLGAPSIEAGIAASAMAQDEWGHARLLYATLKDFGEDPLEVEHARPPEEYASADPLDEGFPDWAAVTVGIVLVDGALEVALEGIAEGGYASLEGRVGKMRAEEEFHRSLGEAWFRRLAGGSEEARSRLRTAAEGTLHPILRCLGPEDEAHRRIADLGLTFSAEELRRRLVARVAPFLDLLGVEAPEGGPDMAGWDPKRGRGERHPSPEAVERARGDRNRALFVE